MTLPVRQLKMFAVAVIFVQLLVLSSCSKSDDWDHLVFTRQWPQTACMDFNQKHMKCIMPPGVDGWTIHGIWPSAGTRHGPSSCQMAKPFDEHELEDLLPQLRHHWPTLRSDGPATNFWKHEWDKHGRCAASLAELAGQKNYFSRTIDLHNFYNVDKILKDNGIVPSDDNPYRVSDIMHAFESAFGHPVLLQCMHHRATGKQYLIQMEMCISKDLKSIDCPTKSRRRRGGRSCYDDIYIPLIKAN